MSNPENSDNEYLQRSKDILEKAFGKSSVSNEDVPHESLMREATDEDNKKRKPGYQMSKKQLSGTFEGQAKDLNAIKISAELGDVGGAQDEPDPARILKESLTPRHLKELELLKALADPNNLNKLGEVEADKGLEVLPPREVLEKSISQGGVLDEEPARIIEAVAKAKIKGFTSETIVQLLEDYKNTKSNEREAVISFLKKYTPEELKERSDFVKSIGETLVNGTIPLDQGSLRTRDIIVQTLGHSKSRYAVDILERYTEFIRTNEYIISQEKPTHWDIYRNQDYVGIMKALNSLEEDLKNEEQQEKYIELIGILRDQVLDYIQEGDRRIGEWKEQNPGWALAPKNAEDLSDRDYETNNPIRVEILGWKDAYDKLDEKDKNFFISNFRQMADGPVIAEEILQCLEEDPTDESLRQLYQNFSRTLGGNQAERLGGILLNDSVAFDSKNSTAKEELIKLVVRVASRGSLEAIKKFSEKVSNYEYLQNEDDFDNPPELLRKKDQELILWALSELEENMGGIDNIELAKLRDEAQNNHEDAAEEYEKWKKNHPQHAI